MRDLTKELTLENLIKLTTKPAPEAPQEPAKRKAPASDGSGSLSSSSSCSEADEDEAEAVVIERPHLRDSVGGLDQESSPAALPQVVVPAGKQKARASSGAQSAPVSLPPLGRRKSSVEGAAAIPLGRRASNGCVSLPNLGRRNSQAGMGACGSEPRLNQDDLTKLPANEALRQLLIQQAGSLKAAYNAMDVNKMGTVNQEQFETGMSRLNVYGRKIVGVGDAAALFHMMDVHGFGVISLQDLLGYMPVRHKFADTRTALFDYHNKASAQRSRLARKPCWRDCEFGEDADFPRVQGGELELLDKKRRDLRRLLRDVGNSCPQHYKRAFVAGLVSPEHYAEVRVREKQQAMNQEKRIRGAIGACSRSRTDLVGLQQAMKLVAQPTKVVRFGRRGGIAEAPSRQPEVNVMALCEKARNGGRRASITFLA